MKTPQNIVHTEPGEAPPQVQVLHDEIAAAAAKVIAEFLQHAPLAFLEPRSPAGRIVDLSLSFGDQESKHRAILALRHMVCTGGYEEVCFVCEASALIVPEGEIVPSSIADRPDAIDILAITIERPGALYCWSHTVTVLDDGSRTMSPEFSYAKYTPGGMGRVALLFLPENCERENKSYETNN